jgi:hypothetical protein
MLIAQCWPFIRLFHILISKSQLSERVEEPGRVRKNGLKGSRAREDPSILASVPDNKLSLVFSSGRLLRVMRIENRAEYGRGDYK